MSEGEGSVATRTFVDVHAIEEELAELRWKLAPDAASEAAQHAANEARASVLNLITVVATEVEAREVARMMSRLSVHHPSRTLILVAQEERVESKLEAHVAAESHADSGHQVLTEQVVIHAHGTVAEHLASLVTPLLIPDLPVMLWWPGRPDFDSRLFAELTDLCDRLVVDTDDGFEPADFVRLLEVARRTKSRCAIGDFNWARLMPWRHLAAQFFDMPGMLPRLTGIQGVFVLAGEGSNAEALLLAGWVQSRLARVGISVPREVRRDNDLEHGVSRFMLYTGGEAGAGRFSISRNVGGRLVTEVRIGDQEQGGQTVRVAPQRPEDLLAIELTLPGHDVLYEEALAAAAQP